MTAASRRPLPRRLTAAGVAAAALVGALGQATPAAATGLGYTASNKGSLHHIAAAVGAHDSYRAGFTGKGIGIALIDTGVTNVPGLHTGNVVDGPDLSFDSQDPELAHQDAYGHGTHLASIIAGRDAIGTPASYTDPAAFAGIAPDATLLDVKVGASDGAVDVSQVIAAINWVVAHKNDNGMNIRVINLSYGTDSTQASAVDPLAFAVENAWKNGIVVVVAGGNDGRSELTLANPARDPFVLAIGALDTAGTASNRDDTVPTWSTRGSNARHVDLVAPGASVLGLRVPNGYADEGNSGARVGQRFAKASGTSQAAAVVSGEVALLLQSNPNLTPDQVKYQLLQSAVSFPNSSSLLRGAGTTHVRYAQTRSVPKSAVAQNYVWGTGTGSLEKSRGSSHVSRDDVALQGEVDIFGNAWDGAAWASATTARTVWNGGLWRGYAVTGDGWDGTTYRTVDWGMAGWDGRLWRDAEWTGRLWRDGSWTAGTWTGRLWRDVAWTGRLWRAADLASASWS